MAQRSRQSAKAASADVDVRTAASMVGRHPETVRRWVWSGRLPARRQGNRLVMARAAVEAIAARDSGQALDLSQWVRRAQSQAAAGGGKRARRGAADLVLEDRAARAGR